MATDKTLFSNDEWLTKLAEMAKKLDEADVPSKDRHVIVTEASCVNLFGEEEGKECWKELLARCPDDLPNRIMDPTKVKVTPPWTH
jgi:hypothetical protein